MDPDIMSLINRASCRALSGWVDGALAIDIRRVVKLELNGYHVRTQTIPATVTPKNRLLVAYNESASGWSSR